MRSVIEKDRFLLPPIQWKENYSDSFDRTEYNLEFSKDALDNFVKSSILAIEENKSTLKVKR